MIFNPSFDPLSNYELEVDTGILNFDSDDGRVRDGAEVEVNNILDTYGKKKLRQK